MILIFVNYNCGTSSSISDDSHRFVPNSAFCIVCIWWVCSQYCLSWSSSTLSYWWYHVGSHPKSHILGFCKRGIKLSGIVLFSHAWELGIHLVGYRNTHFAHTHEVLASNLKSIKGGGDYHSDPYEIRNVEHYWYPLSYKVIFPDDSCNNDRKQHVPSFSGHVELLSPLHHLQVSNECLCNEIHALKDCTWET